MRVVVDTNIVFSALLNSNGTIGRLLTGADRRVDFFSCEFLKVELHLHQPRLLSLTGLAKAELEELQALVTNRIEFINEGLLPLDELLSAETLLKDIDTKDTPFLALSNCLDAWLWTGDKVLTKGLRAKGYERAISTTEFLEKMNALENR